VIQVEGEREHTINKVVAFFKKYERRLVGVGIGCFGPIGLNPENKQDYGKILLTTPKQKWRGYPILADMVERLKVPISLTQNVNASLLGEVEFGVGKGKKLETCVYFTVGAGIGAGIIANGDFVRGLSHPELGHILVPRASEEKKGFDGICIHKICLEGMASGWAIEKRWGKPGERLGDRDDVWTLEARYLSYGIASIILTLMPQLIILGGGVMEAPKLLGKIHSEVEGYLGRYIKVPEIDSNIESYIVMPALKGKDGIYESGIRGAIALAQEQQRTI
jgi:fructokinase